MGGGKGFTKNGLQKMEAGAIEHEGRNAENRPDNKKALTLKGEGRS